MLIKYSLFCLHRSEKRATKSTKKCRILVIPSKKEKATGINNLEQNVLVNQDAGWTDAAGAKR